MTDRHDDPLEERLEGWFAAEVERARVDLRHRPVGHGPGRVAPGSPRFGLVVGVLIVAVVLVGLPLAVGRTTRTDDSPAPTAHPSTGPVASPKPMVSTIVGEDLDVTGWSFDGVPASIGGERVMRPAEWAEPSASTIRLPGWLLGGWVQGFLVTTCATGSPECRRSVVLGDGESNAVTGTIPGAPNAPPVGSIAVYRLTQTGSELVWAADPAVFIDDRFDDGIPLHVGGEEVIPVADLVATLETFPDDRSVLVGGWAWQVFGMRCRANDRINRSELLTSCDPLLLTSQPGRTGMNGIPVVPKLDAQSLPVVTDDHRIPDGPVILRVHGHDARAADCVSWLRDECDAAVVVDEIVWSGDEWTETVPLTIYDVVLRLDAAGIEVDLAIVPSLDEANALAECAADWPPQDWQAIDSEADDAMSGRVSRIGVFATTADRERVLATLGPQGLNDGKCPSSLIDSFGGSRWIGIDNVIVGVPFRWDEPETDVHAREALVRKALIGP